MFSFFLFFPFLSLRVCFLLVARGIFNGSGGVAGLVASKRLVFVFLPPSPFEFFLLEKKGGNICSQKIFSYNEKHIKNKTSLQNLKLYFFTKNTFFQGFGGGAAPKLFRGFMGTKNWAFLYWTGERGTKNKGSNFTNPFTWNNDAYVEFMRFVSLFLYFQGEGVVGGNLLIIFGPISLTRTNKKIFHKIFFFPFFTGGFFFGGGTRGKFFKNPFFSFPNFQKIFESIKKNPPIFIFFI